MAAWSGSTPIGQVVAAIIPDLTFPHSAVGVTCLSALDNVQIWLEVPRVANTSARGTNWVAVRWKASGSVNCSHRV